MRETKCRAWDVACRTWRYGSAALLFETGNELSMSELWSGIEYGRYINPCWYTGLTDKHGKDVYEGDVVEEYVYGIGTGGEYSVVWDSEDLTYKVGAAMLGGTECKVVSNIYENPELLK